MKAQKLYSEAMLKKYEKMKTSLCHQHLYDFRKINKIVKHKFIHQKGINTDPQGMYTERPTTTPVIVGSPIELRKADYKLKTANLGVLLDRPLGIRTHKNIDNLENLVNKNSDYVLFRNNAFAPKNLAQTLSKIQSLENFFKHESLSFSENKEEFKNFNETEEERPNTVKSYVPIKTSNVFSMPTSPIKEHENSEERRSVFSKKRQ